MSRLVVPYYIQAYEIVHQALVNAVLNYEVKNKKDIENLVEKLRSKVSALVAKLTLASQNCDDVRTRAGKHEESVAGSMSHVEDGIRRYLSCQNELRIAINAAQHQINLANHHHQQTQANLASSQANCARAKERYDDCLFFRCGWAEDDMNDACSAASDEAARVAAANHPNTIREATDKKLKLETQDARLDTILKFLQEGLQKVKQQQSSLATITSKLKEASSHISGFHTASTVLQMVIRDLFELVKVVKPLNDIYDEMVNHYKMEPFADGLITTESIADLKRKLTTIESKAKTIDENIVWNSKSEENE
ncbi:unnamed protein product [Adineta steineri]|uniref:Uncharacterized protein n=1 Tax=Adineta steineri TaxID=433720 RepID=A0A819R2T9_9BILA|nr:unnamed protein product [Adineta steineri]CAF4033695.1 unnamed protein product [Adineta steineri]